ncbi:metallophosphoesterase family protein [Acuticoccus sp.]|uniref:metallophosphoesterase family protein n=1 Tax=Acuticoccus sp. TaxID=1904378 RepID=UPI003B52A037
MIPPLPAGVRLYVVGDIHGCATMLDRLTEEIDADIARHPAERVLEVFLGDYVDRGADCAGVLSRVAAEVPGRERVRLMGNHEDAMVEALADGSRMDRWLAFGGDATLRSYGIEPNEYAHAPHALQPIVQSVIPPEHTSLLERLALQHRVGDILFVHAGIRQGVALEEQDRHDLMWIREEFYDAPGPWPVYVVHGHTPVAAPEVFAHRANLDTGAVYGGPLTALVLEGDRHRFISVPYEA